MPLPKYFEMHKPFLEYLGDGKEHKLKELKVYVSQQFGLTEEELAELLPSGRQTVFINRLGWARTYLKKAGLIASPARATFVITEEGKKVLRENPEVIDVDYLMRYEKFQEFQGVLNSRPPARSAAWSRDGPLRRSWPVRHPPGWRRRLGRIPFRWGRPPTCPAGAGRPPVRHHHWSGIECSRFSPRFLSFIVQ